MERVVRPKLLDFVKLDHDSPGRVLVRSRLNRFLRSRSGPVVVHLACALVAVLLHAGTAGAACNIIPAAKASFRGFAGSVNRPFAKPGDWVEVSLAGGCAASPGFVGQPSDFVVLLVFAPISGARHLVGLTSTPELVEPRLDECVGSSGVEFVSTPPSVLACGPGQAAGCGFILKNERTLSFRFPTVHAVAISPDGDPISLGPRVGPVKIAVLRAGAPIPCELATTSCRLMPESAGLLACIDDLYADDSTCTPTLDPVFSSFTSLPVPNDYQALCTAPAPPCTGEIDQLRIAVDRDGNLLVPVDWRGILVDRDAVPVARLLRGTVSAPAFQGELAPFAIAARVSVGSFSPEGVRLPPIFDPQVGSGAADGATLFGTADAPDTVLRIARRHGSCGGGGRDGLVCTGDRDCPDGTCHDTCVRAPDRPCATDDDCSADGGPGGSCGQLFDFTGRTGPIGLVLDDFSLQALDPVPLDGLNQTAELNAFVLEEAIADQELNGDGDLRPRDHVATLSDRSTGEVIPIGRLLPGGAYATGRAVARIQQQPFSLPGLAASDDVLAFLEPEAAQGNTDSNQNQSVFETILRAFRRDGARATDLLEDLNLSVDAAPVIDARSIKTTSTDGGVKIFYRLSEPAAAAQVTRLESIAASGVAASASVTEPVLSRDGRSVAFSSAAPNLVAPPRVDANGRSDVFVRDLETGAVTRVSVATDGTEANADSIQPAISGDGRYVAFTSEATNLVATPPPACPCSVFDLSCPTFFVTTSCAQVYVRDRDADGDGVLDEDGATRTVLVSVTTSGGAADRRAWFPAISADGRFVTFSSFADNLDPSPTQERSCICTEFDTARGCAVPGIQSKRNCFDVFRHDRDTDEDGIFDEPGAIATTLVSAPPSGVPIPSGDSLLSSVSDDGKRIAYNTFVVEGAGGAGGGLLRGMSEYFVRDLRASPPRTEEIGASLDVDNLSLLGEFPAMSADGTLVAYSSGATDLIPGDTNGTTDVFVQSLETGVVDRVSVASDGWQGDGDARLPAMSSDGRYVAFTSGSTTLVAEPPAQCDCFSFESCATRSCVSVYVHDRLTSQTRRVSIGEAGQAIPVDTIYRPSISGDARAVAFSPGDAPLLANFALIREVVPQLPSLDLPRAEVLLRTADPTDTGESGADLTGDGDVDDFVLEVLDGASGERTPISPATKASVRGSRVAWLRPERAGAAPDLVLDRAVGDTSDGDAQLGNADGDLDDDVVFFWDGGAALANLGRAATDVVLGDSLIAALVSESGDGERYNADTDRTDLVAQVYDLKTRSWLTGPALAAERIAVEGRRVAFLVPEAAEGDRVQNQDGDRSDRIFRVFDADDGTIGPAEALATKDFVMGDAGLIAFRVSEREQGRNFNPSSGDTDTDDDVLFVYDAAKKKAYNTGIAVRPCRLEACDPRLPFVLVGQTVRFLTLECDQGGPTRSSRCSAGGVDFNGDGDADDLVVQLLNLRQGIDAGDFEEARHAIAATAVGLCTDTGVGCVMDSDCAKGTCFVPPGGCLQPQSQVCDSSACPSGQFCLPSADGPDHCHLVVTDADGEPLRCTTTEDCTFYQAFCSEGSQDFQRFVDPLKESDGGAILVSAGRCIEDRGPCAAGCAPGEFCEDELCRRDHGVCAANADCPDVAPCKPEKLSAQGYGDADRDGLPDPLDNCPHAANVDQKDGDFDRVGDACDPQTCGNTIREGDEPCDDGNLVDDDGCDCLAMNGLCPTGSDIAPVRLTVLRLDGDPGDQRLRVRGTIRRAGALADVALADLVARGAELLIEDLGAGGAAVVDLSSGAVPIPPGAAGTGCAVRDGWRAMPDHKRFTYVNRSNQLPNAACRPESAKGLRRLTLSERGAANDIRIEAFFQGLPVAKPVGPLRLTFAFGGRAEALQGECGVSLLECTTPARGRRSCR